jgi:tRNA threonylcarbamoyl adenosine modification protein YeaZ
MSVILGIEGAIGGGSVCLLRNGDLLAESKGAEGLTRAEDLLVGIEELLDRSAMNKREVKSLAVSNGPGSFTGIRVAIATALGLSRALSIDCFGISLFEAIAASLRPFERLTVALPIRQNEVAWQGFDATRLANQKLDPRAGTTEEFQRSIKEELLPVVTTEGLAHSLGATDGIEIRTLSEDLPLAYFIASAAEGGEFAPPEPLYISRHAASRTGF